MNISDRQTPQVPKRRWTPFPWAKKATSGRRFLRKSWNGSALRTQNEMGAKSASVWRDAAQRTTVDDTKSTARFLSRSAPPLALLNEGLVGHEDDILLAGLKNNREQAYVKQESRKSRCKDEGHRPCSHSEAETSQNPKESTSSQPPEEVLQDATCQVLRCVEDAKSFAVGLHEIHKSKPPVYGTSLLPIDDIAFWTEHLLVQIADSARRDEKHLDHSISHWQTKYLPLDAESVEGLKDSRGKQTHILENIIAVGTHNFFVDEDSSSATQFDLEGQGMFIASLSNTPSVASPLVPLLFCPRKRMRAVSKAYIPAIHKLLDQVTTIESSTAAPSMSGSKLERQPSKASSSPTPSAWQQRRYFPKMIQYIAPETLYDNIPEGTLCEPTGVVDTQLPLCCSICLTDIDCVNEATQISKCGHCFHSKCLSRAMTRSRQCPVCRDWIGFSWGKMPNAKMVVDDVPNLTCAGFEPGVMVITYAIAAGIQEEYHDNPGVPFGNAYRTAFLPQCEEGYALLRRLQIAFSRGLTCSIGISPVTGLDNSVVWSSIPHKLHLDGRSADSFPDDNYFAACHKYLDSLGIPRRGDKKKKKTFQVKPTL